MLWSIIPEDVVYNGFGQEDLSLFDYEVENCPCRLRRLTDGGVGVEAVCSTNPKDFMRPSLQPGSRIYLFK